MSTVEEFRKILDANLDQWELGALALEAQLESTRSEILDRVESQKKRMAAAGARLRQAIERSAVVADDTKNQIIGAMQNLQLQLTLGMADARDDYLDKKQRIMDAVAAVDAQIAQEDAELGREWEQAVQEWIRAETALAAELEAATIQYEIGQSERRAEFEARKGEIAEMIRAFRTDLDARRKEATERLATFEGEFRSGLAQIRKAFADFIR